MYAKMPNTLDSSRSLQFYNRDAEERNLVDVLVDFYDELCEKEIVTEALSSEDLDIIRGWQRTVPNPKYVQQSPRKRKITQKAQDDSITPSGSETRIVEVTSSAENLNGKLPKTNSMWDWAKVPIWRSCVEPTTYRYIPNNGRYRESKYIKKLEIQKSVKKTTEKLSPEQRHLQKEIQRELKREFELYHMEKQKSQLKEIVEKKRRESFTGGGEEIHRRYRHDYQASPCALPPINAPLVHRSLNEKYMEGFTDKMSALDEEMKKDMKLLRKSQDDGAIRERERGSFRSKSEPPSVCHQDANYVYFPPRTETVTQETFSVKQMPWGQPVAATGYVPEKSQTPVSEQRPHRHVSVTQLKYTSASGETITIPKFGHGEAPPASTFYGALDRENTQGLNGKTSPVGDTSTEVSCAKESLHSVMTTSKYARSSNSRNTKSKLHHSNSAEISRNSHIDLTVGDGFRSVPVGKSRNRQRKENAFAPKSLLPEISGRRLEVAQGNNRLL